MIFRTAIDFQEEDRSVLVRDTWQNLTASKVFIHLHAHSQAHTYTPSTFTNSAHVQSEVSLLTAQTHCTPVKNNPSRKACYKCLHAHTNTHENHKYTQAHLREMS